MRLRIWILALALAASALAASKAVERCLKAAETLDEIMAASDKSIPRDLLDKAHCVAIVPGLKKGALVFGVKKGSGVLSCRGEGGRGWTGPSTIRIEGGSFGLQIGGSSTDVVLLVMNESGKKNLLESKFTLGADARVAAGPIGRAAEAQTDAQMDAQILSYSRSKGVFAGVSLEGATLRGDKDEDADLYGQSVSREAILSGRAAPPADCDPLMDALNKYSPQENK